MTELVRNISDTARWVAGYRAQESARKDALFQDHLADRLAGERGRAIAGAAIKHAAWALVTRTRLIDDLVATVVKDGTDRILNLAAGFDTRPYRLPLPPELRWVEADLPALIEEKNELLTSETPRCRLERAAVDLSVAEERERFLAEHTAGASKVTVITEGLVIYLTEELVAAMAKSFTANRAIRYWILDFNSPRIKKDMTRRLGKMLENAPVQFAPPNGIAFFENLGWKPREVQSLFHAAARFKRLAWWMRPFAIFPAPDVRDLKNDRWSGIVLLERD